MIFLITILAFISFSLIIYFFLLLIFLRQRAVERLDKYFKINSYEDMIIEDSKKSKRISVLQIRGLLNELGKKTAEVLLMKKYITRVQYRLIKAGLPLKGEEFIAVQMLCLSGIMLLIYYLSRSILISVLLGFLGWLLPSLILKFRTTKRYKLFNDQLGDSILIISNSLKAGHSFLQAVDSVATEMPDPISFEFKKLLKELRLGASTERALENLLLRVESDDLELVINAVMIQREIGGNLSEILDNISETIRERVRLKGEIRTLTAQGRISGIVVSILPVALGFILHLLNPEYMTPLFSNKNGIMILTVSFVSQIIGIILVNQIVKIEV